MSDEFDSWQLEGRKYMRDVAVQRRSRRDTKQARSSHWNKNPKPSEPRSRGCKKQTIAAVNGDSCFCDLEVDDNESDSKNWNLAALDQGTQCDMPIPEMAPRAITSFSGYAAKLARFLGFGYSTLDQLSSTTNLAPDDFDFIHDENQEEDWVVLTT
ncbi:hypothetical protein SARC_03519 [Sphaeroforma arctica JP610]|uniref:Uncharacterized protein n=1 Tax=Sphaeroforma arctica JP610 TaxID=667725 RepID=A0A0L0G5D1_9EUKA|nr:hypothetical protein SARC_03519 [Sphaeroforma arctica JP610]KNC84247.1 hypothetical protein SARC_03519 [Sphaeroforma arctica JP610]|eukprot:XP_014158149.1 hypothetical protein SARC_03519 [Sphaeroforma arctica JP610]